MEQYQNLYLIGSSHISKQSINEIKKAVEEIKPDIIAVELDKDRAYALIHQKKSNLSFKDIGRIGLKGFLFASFGGFMSKKLGKIVGVQPGSEMKSAIQLAKQNKLKIAFIDQHIQITLKRFSQTLTWKERWNFVVDIFNALILRKKDPLLNFDIRKVPEDELIQKMMDKIKIRYPNIHKTIVDERNYFMARKLKNLMHSGQKILAIVGAGHKRDILNILKENEGITYSFTFNANI